MRPKDIKKGDYIKIRGSRVHLRTLEGEVLSANNYGDRDWKSNENPKPFVSDDWYIEIKDIREGYAYWKQQEDGGFIDEHVEGGKK